MENCFVIQPFDNGNFSKRYEETFKPAIEKAGLNPYRVDEDLSVRIPIEDIEKGIAECAMCFAEISTDNPNVWYELGYSFAYSKDVVMVCSDERKEKFPFDIQHRQIIKYKTGSKSAYEDLEEAITKKIKAFQVKSETVQKLQSTPVVETEGLKSNEIALLIILAEDQLISQEGKSVHALKREMNKAGYTDIATGVAIKILKIKNFVTVETEVDQWGDGTPYTAATLTEKGENWILSNQDQLVFRKPTDNSKEDNLPF